MASVSFSPKLQSFSVRKAQKGSQRLEFEPVAGATGYAVQFTTAADTKFSSFNKETTPNTFFDFNPFFDSFRWRVRAIFGEIPGSWSEVRLFSHNASVGNGFTLPFDPVADTAPLSFSFLYQPPRLCTVVSVAVSERPDMTDPLFEKTYQQSTNQFSDWIGELPANRQLYFRIIEINPDNERLPQGVMVDFTFGFKTGTARPDPRIHFMTRYAPAIFGKSSFNLALSANHV